MPENETHVKRLATNGEGMNQRWVVYTGSVRELRHV